MSLPRVPYFPEAPSPEVAELVERLCHGDLTSADGGRLEQLVTSDRSIRQFYVRYLQMHATLPWLVVGGLVAVSTNPESGLALPTTFNPTCPVLSSPRFAAIAPPNPVVGLVGALSRKLPGGTFTVGTLIVLVVVAAFWGLATQVFQMHPRGGANLDSAFATITDSVGVDWADGSTNSISSTTVRYGDVLNLDSGLVQLQLQQGATLVVEGPAEWSIDGDNRATLTLGKLVARVPKQAIGFTLSTSSGEIVDLGTEFGVVVAMNQESEVQVFNGRVSVQPKSAENTTLAPRILSAGESTTITNGDHPGEFVLCEPPDRPAKLSRKLPRKNAIPQTRYPQSLIAYWNFDEQNREGIAWDLCGNNHGMLVGVERVPGLVGTGAAGFNNTNGQAVRMPAGSLGHAFAEGMTIEVLFTSSWSGKALDYDELFRKQGLVTFSFQNDHNDQIDGPVLALEFAGCVSLDMPLDGREGRPSLAEITDGKPHHAVATGDGTTGKFAIFIDGVERFSQIVSPKLSFNGGDEATPLIGNYSGNLEEPFSGIIDEVALYAAALPAERIAEHWHKVRSGINYFESPDANTASSGQKPTGQSSEIDILSTMYLVTLFFLI